MAPSPAAYNSLCSWESSVSISIVLATSRILSPTLSVAVSTGASVVKLVLRTMDSGLGTPSIPINSVSKTVGIFCQHQACTLRLKASFGGYVLNVDPAGIGPIDRWPYPLEGGIVRVLRRAVLIGWKYC